MHMIDNQRKTPFEITIVIELIIKCIPIIVIDLYELTGMRREVRLLVIIARRGAVKRMLKKTRKSGYIQ